MEEEKKELKKYVDGLPESMGLKKKVIKTIMTTKQPLSQKGKFGGHELQRLD